MLLIPGWLFALLTAPGVALRQLARKLACRFFAIEVYSTCYFTLVPPIGGYVHHAEPRNAREYAGLSLAPLAQNTVIAFLLGWLAGTLVYHDVVPYVLIWLGVSAGSHCFVSSQEAEVVRSATAGEWYGTEKWKYWIISPILGILSVFSSLRFFWSDLLYGLAATYAGVFLAWA